MLRIFGALDPYLEQTAPCGRDNCRRLPSFVLAGVSAGHAHRFRDTFAVELLLAGAPLERVSILLGHQSVRVTERYYAAWTDSRQRQVEADRVRVETAFEDSIEGDGCRR